jgi:PhnB protein
MARVSTYLNFMGNAEEAFEFYRSVFGSDYLGPIQCMGDVPAGPEGPALSESEKHKVMHVELPILGGHVLMATAMLESMGHELKVGDNVTINLEPDSREETQRLFDALSEGSAEADPWPLPGLPPALTVRRAVRVGV